MSETKTRTHITQVGTIGIDTQVRFTTQADHADLRARGVEADAEVMRYPVPMFVFRDPDGNRLIMVERG
jgi:hypothetical protein